MFYDEQRASLACEGNPQLIFYFINGGYKQIVEKINNEVHNGNNVKNSAKLQQICY